MALKIYITILIIVVVLIEAALVAQFFLPQFKSGTQDFLAPDSEIVKQKESAPSKTFEESYDAALRTAREWSPEAQLVYTSAVSGENGEGAFQKRAFVFSSVKKLGSFFHIAMDGARIIESEERQAARAAPVPKTPLVNYEAQAIARVKNMPGFEDAKIFGVEAVPSAEGEAWYFGVQTDKGTVSVEVR